MTYNPPYYANLLEGCGLTKVQDLYAFWGHIDMLDSVDKKQGADKKSNKATRIADAKKRLK